MDFSLLFNLLRIVILGISADYFTTLIGLQWGLVEIHAMYSPLNAFLFFIPAIVLLSALNVREVWFTNLIYLLSFTVWLGAINNTFVLLNLYSGLRI